MLTLAASFFVQYSVGVDEKTDVALVDLSEKLRKFYVETISTHSTPSRALNPEVVKMFKGASLHSASRILNLSASMVTSPGVAFVSGQRFYFSGGTSGEQTYDFSTGFMVDIDNGLIASWDIPRLEVDSEIRQQIRIACTQSLFLTDEEFERIGFSVIIASRPESLQNTLDSIDVYICALICNDTGLLGIVAISQDGKLIDSYRAKGLGP